MIDEFGNNVILINKLPVRAVSTPNEDGSYSIFINAQLSDQKRMECYMHELKHICNDDFSKLNVQEIEYDAHT